MREQNPFDRLRGSIALPAMVARLAAIVLASNSYKTAIALCEQMDKLSHISGSQQYAKLIEHNVLCSSTEWTHTHDRLRRFAVDYLARHSMGIA